MNQCLQLLLLMLNLFLPRDQNWWKSLLCDSTLFSDNACMFMMPVKRGSLWMMFQIRSSPGEWTTEARWVEVNPLLNSSKVFDSSSILTIKKIISNLFSSHTSVGRLNIRYIRTEYFDQYAINTSYYIMFNRFECAYYSVKHFIMFVNDFTVKCYWIIWIHDVDSQWKFAALLFVNENWRSLSIFFFSC